MIQRNPADKSPDWSIFDRDFDDWDYPGEDLDLVAVVEHYPEEVAEILKTWGYSADGLWEDIATLQARRFVR
jgi:uncharacterized protein YozE (UPF0346 family)